MPVTRIALVTLMALSGIDVGAQAVRSEAIVRVGFGPTHVSGGEYLSHAASAFSVDGTRNISRLPIGDLRIGLGLLYPNWDQDPSAVCHIGVHHPCIGSFPSITGAHVDVGWQTTAMNTALEADLQPTVYWVARRSPPAFAPAAALSLQRSVWRSVGGFVSGSAMYFSSVYGDKIGLEVMTFGLYLR